MADVKKTEYKFEILNTKAAWMEKEIELIDAFSCYAQEGDERVPITFRIGTSQDYSAEVSDQNNLVYFFIFYHRLIRILELYGWSDGKMKGVTIHLYVPSKDSVGEDLHAEHYLSYLLSNIDNEKITLRFHSAVAAYSNSEGKWDRILFPRTRRPRILGRISPLIRVKREEYIALMMVPKGLNEIIENMLSDINKKNNNYENRREAAFSDEVIGKLRIYYDKKTSGGILRYLYLGNILRILVDNKLEFWAVNNNLFECFSRFVNEDVSIHALLTKTIWSLIVRFSIDPGKHDPYLKYLTPGIFRKFLQKTLMDAQAYAEGIYQLIENSVMYSESQCAYFSLNFNAVDPNSSMRSESVKAAQYRERIEAKYSVKKADDVGSVKYQFDVGAQHSLEIPIVDDGIKLSRDTNGCLCVESNGIIKQWNKKGDSEKISVLRDAFRPKRGRENMIHHYGLSTFMRSILLNGGVFAVSSPSSKDIIVEFGTPPDKYIATLDESVTLNESGDFKRDVMCTLTEYDIMLPIRFRSKEMPSVLRHSNIREVYMQEVWGNDIKKIVLGAKEVETAVNTIRSSLKQSDNSIIREKSQKLNVIQKGSSDFYDKYFLQAAEAKENIVLFLVFLEEKIEEMYHLNVEVLAKFLMNAIMRFKEDIPGKKLLFALLFKESHFMYEFVRIFSVFYDFSGENAFLDDVQIALLQKSDIGYAVNLILTGRKLYAAQDTARLFAYFNADDSIGIIPVIDYLSEIRLEKDKKAMGKGKNNLPSLFPFELYIREEDFNSGKILSPPGIPLYRTESLFYNRISRELDTDMRDSAERAGYKIGDSLVRLGSKILVDTFYQAELLLQNVGNVYRFAFILTEYYLRKTNSLEMENRPEHLLLVGYEYYSEILLKETERLLNQKNPEFCRYCIVPSDPEKQIKFPYEKYVEGIEEWEKPDVLVVIPIGTTLRTFHRIKGRMLQSYDKLLNKTKIKEAFTLVWVAATDDTAELQKRYIKNHDSEKKEIHLENAVANEGDESVKIFFYLKVEANWFDPRESLHDKPAGRRALIGVDGTSLLPDAIFMRSEQHIPIFANEENPGKPTMEERIAYLKGNVVYGHVAKERNHFQFYINTPNMFLNEDMRTEVTEKASEWRKQIDPYAFNILISPLEEKNADFVKTVIDETFDNSILFIHIADMLHEYRDCIRTKYRTAIDEYKRIKSQYRSQRINIYYIDNSITTGQSIRRARDMVIMLLEQSGVDFKREEIFKGIFLLYNRSSFETLNPIVSEPGNVFSFINIRIPSFNMDRDECPTCKIHDLNEKMEAQSSTRAVMRIYHKQKIKYEWRNGEQAYLNWEYLSILNDNVYFEWLRHWMYRHCKAVIRICKVPNSGIKSEAEYIEKFFETLRSPKTSDTPPRNIKDAVALYEAQEALNSLSKLLDNLDNEREIAEKFFQNEILSERNYQRLVCMDEAWRKLYKIPEGCKSYKEYHYAAFKAIVEMIKNRFDLCDKEKFKYLESMDEDEEQSIIEQHFFSRKDEWLRSYIKVISRQHLADYDHIKQAIFNLMRWLLAETVLVALNSESETEAQAVRKGIADVASDSKDGDYYKTLVRDLYLGELPEYDKLLEGMGIIISNVKSLSPTERYELVILLLRRLANMKYSSILSYDFVRILMKYRDEEERKNNSTAECDTEYEYYNRFQEKAKFVANYTRLCKWVHVSDDDFNKGFAINELISDMMSDADGNSDFEMQKTLMLENTQPIYSGMSSLMRTDVRKELNKTYENLSVEELIDKDYGELWGDIAKALRNDVLPQSFQTPVSGSGQALELESDPDEWPWRYHNIHMPIFRFLCDSVYKFNKESIVGDIKEFLNDVTGDIAVMLRYFCLVRLFKQFRQYAVNNERHVDETIYPRLFTKICECIRDIAKLEECYLVLDRREDGNADILAASPILESRMEEMLSERDIFGFLKKENGGTNDTIEDSTKEDSTSSEIDGIHFFEPSLNKKGDKYRQILTLEVLDLDIKPENQEDAEGKEMFNEGIIRILLVRGIKAENIEDAKADAAKYKANISTYMRIRNVLFLRASLANLIEYCKYALIDLKRRYDYIRKIEEKQGDVRVLHLSDLHIDTENYEGIMGLLEKDNKAFCDANGENNRADLVLITGDIINGRGSAAEVAQNYEYAGKIVKRIAQIVFRYTEKDRNGKGWEYLPPDWQKRIVIVTGNHDYASMNELQTHTGGRMTTVGEPASGEGGTMAKFAYFTDFLRQTLHVDIGELIENDMNFYRRYRSLGANGINVLALNSSSLANPLQNNKVGLGGIANDRFKKNTSDGNEYTLIGIHHTPMFVADYNMDHYYDYEMIEKIENREIQIKSTDELKEITSVFYKVVVDYWRSVNSRKLKRVKDFKMGLLRDYEEMLKTFYKNQLCQDIDCFLNYYAQEEDELNGNELFHRMCDRMWRLKRISEKDNDAYEEFMDALLENANPETTLILGGHQHKHCQDKYKSKQIPVHECARLYYLKKCKGEETKDKECSTLYYSIIKFADGKDRPKVVHYKKEYTGNPASSHESYKLETKELDCLDCEKSPCAKDPTYKKRFAPISSRKILVPNGIPKIQSI
jgi:predicted MPP superfamily phosphohydrolase